jgi:hypothetical protein
MKVFLLILSIIHLFIAISNHRANLKFNENKNYGKSNK